VSKITEQTRTDSYEALDAATIYRHITDISRGILPDGEGEIEGMTAREIAEEMYKRHYIPYPVRQAAAPRLTELERVGVVEVVGKKLDEQTGRKVAVYRLVQL